MPLRPLRLLAAAAFLGAASLHASVLVLSNGDHLTGKVLKHADGKITFHSDVLGDIVVSDQSATAVEPPPSPTPVESMAGLPPHGSVPGKLKGQPAKGTGARTPWTGKVEFGYDNQLTNIRTVNTSLRAEVDRTVGPDDFMGKGRYLYGKSQGLPTTDLGDGEFRVRHNLDSRVFAQSDTTGSSNRLQLINFEGQENLGMGYKLITGLHHTVDVGAGMSGQYLNAEGIQEGWNYLGNVFQDYTYKINGRYTFLEDFSAQYSPDRRSRFGSVSDPTLTAQTGTEQDYAYKFHSTLQGRISRHLSLNLHFEYEYNNAVLDPNARADQRVTTTLGYGF